MSKGPYIKSLEDEFDWKLIDQLHSAVSQVSGFCFEAKKLCVSVVFVVIAVIATFTEKRLDHSIFVAGAVIPFFFWLLDSVGYYYQVKLRVLMDAIRKQIALRNDQRKIVSEGESFIAKNRAEAPIPKRVMSSLFNHSMWLYGVMIGTDLVIWLAYCTGGFS